MATTFSERYEAGEFQAVWTDLRHLREQVCDSVDLLEDARNVAHMAMVRVNHNIDVIIGRLRALGYVFDAPNEAHVPPSDTTRHMLNMMEITLGDLPIVLKAWFEVVGLVNLNGYLPMKGGSRESWTVNQYPDPLIIEYWPDYFQREYALWQADLAEFGDDAVQRFPMVIAPDDYHKEDVSGGAPYTIYLPTRTIDPPIENMWFSATFIQYLQRCMEWGGFAGFGRYDFAPMDVLEQLRAGLLPF